MALSPVVELLTVTVPLYVPDANPFGLAVTAVRPCACGVADPVLGLTLSQDPAAVCACTENKSVPVPALNTPTDWVNEVVGLIGNVKDKPVWSSDRWGVLPGATCSVTVIGVLTGLPNVEVTVMVAW